jgi:hypothetical protein
VGIERAQSVETVDGDGEERAGVEARAGVVGFVDDRLDPGALQRHSGYRTGDAAADDQSLLVLERTVHDGLLSDTGHLRVVL